MPLQNRVQPDGEILAVPTRGRYMGNRGILHDDGRRLGRKRWQHKAWVTCLLSFKDRKRPLMAPNAYTELFFFDEAVAFAAGHRPCAECRRADYQRFCKALGLKPPISEFDTVLHAARAIPRQFGQRRWQCSFAEAPTGAFVWHDGLAHLVQADSLVPFQPTGYGRPIARPTKGDVTVLTPEPLVKALMAGYRLDIALGA